MGASATDDLVGDRGQMAGTATAVLLLVLRLICVAKEVAGTVHVETGDGNTARHRSSGAGSGIQRLCSLRQRLAQQLPPTVDDDGELVTADPADSRADHVDNCVAQRVGRFLEEEVTGGMTEGVVHDLETVEIAHHQRHVLTSDGRAGEDLPQGGVEHPTIAEPGEGIAQRELLQIGQSLGLRDAGAELVGDGLEGAEIGRIEFAAPGLGGSPYEAPDIVPQHHGYRDLRLGASCGEIPMLCVVGVP